MQRSRRTNPYPFTWEIPLALIVAVLLLLLIGAQAGRSVANAAAGNGWVFIDRAQLFSTLAGIAAGHADTGLTGIGQPSSAGLLWACITVVEVAVLAACTTGLTVGLRRWGPTRLHGMATAAQAETLLGRTRLRTHAQLIRPDLYGPPPADRR